MLGFVVGVIVGAILGFLMALIAISWGNNSARKAQSQYDEDRERNDPANWWKYPQPKEDEE